MLNCTHVLKQGRCRTPATFVLTWDEIITEGWQLKVDRVYCNEHAQPIANILRRRGIDVLSKELK